LDAANLPEKLRLEGLECPELEAPRSSSDAEDVQARERADAALAALVQLAVAERRHARRQRGNTDRALSATHQMEEHVEFAVEKYKRLRDENERLRSGEA